MNFFLAMMLNPAVQAKAQAEIDSVVGRDRLPTIADQASLPYVRSVVTEVFRLNPPIPLGEYFFVCFCFFHHSFLTFLRLEC